MFLAYPLSVLACTRSSHRDTKAGYQPLVPASFIDRSTVSISRTRSPSTSIRPSRVTSPNPISGLRSNRARVLRSEMRTLARGSMPAGSISGPRPSARRIGGWPIAAWIFCRHPFFNGRKSKDRHTVLPAESLERISFRLLSFYYLGLMPASCDARSLLISILRYTG